MTQGLMLDEVVGGRQARYQQYKHKLKLPAIIASASAEVSKAPQEPLPSKRVVVRNHPRRHQPTIVQLHLEAEPQMLRASPELVPEYYLRYPDLALDFEMSEEMNSGSPTSSRPQEYQAMLPPSSGHSLGLQ